MLSESEENSSYHAVYASLGAFMFNIFYERHLMELNNSYLNYRLGYGYWSDWGGSGNNIYANWQYIIGKQKHHLDIGLGIWYHLDDCCGQAWFMGFDNIYVSDLYPLINVSYRFEKPDGGWLFRAGAGSESFINLSIGYAFKRTRK